MNQARNCSKVINEMIALIPKDQEEFIAELKENHLYSLIQAPETTLQWEIVSETLQEYIGIPKEDWEFEMLSIFSIIPVDELKNILNPIKNLKIIIVLGYNGTGKTTFCNKFVEKYPYFKFYNQPEKGLHPKLHGDLVNAALSENDNVLIETHSDIIHLRVRNLVVQEKLKPDQVLFLWLEEETEMELTLDSEGSFSDFPTGVFEEDLKELMEIDRALSKRLNTIKVDQEGVVHTWPAGVFTESVNELLEIRKNVRNKKQI